MTEHRVHWPAPLIAEAPRLASKGLGDGAISAATGIPQATVRTYRWLHRRAPPLPATADRCRTINRFKTKLPSGRIETYEYPRHFFSNLSPDILRMFADTCDVLGIRWTRSHRRNISVSHRHSVARMDEFIGPKR